MKNIPITAFEAYLRHFIGYLPIIVPPFYYDDQGAWVIPLVYFCTGLWMLPVIAFTKDRETLPEAEKILERGLAPLGLLYVAGLGLSFVIYLIFGGGRY